MACKEITKAKSTIVSNKTMDNTYMHRATNSNEQSQQKRQQIT